MENPETLRISLDTKAKVKIGEFSRGGVARGQKSVAPPTMICIPTPYWYRPVSWKLTTIN